VGTEQPGSLLLKVLLLGVWAAAFILDSMASDDWITGIVLTVAVAVGTALLVAGQQPRPVQVFTARNGILLPAACWLGIMAAVFIGARNDMATYLPIVLMYFPLWGVVRAGSLEDLKLAPKTRFLWLGAMAAMPMCIVYLWPLGDRYLYPRLLFLAPLAAGFSLISAALPEELFFRRFLQTSLIQAFSARNGILLAAALFGLYHYPFALWMPDWPTYGHPLLALVYVLNQKFMLGILFGVIYFRTSSLLAAVVGHTLINTCWLLSASFHQ
jgi:membrane protease YdiL (CAAX protease family)